MISVTLYFFNVSRARANENESNKRSDSQTPLSTSAPGKVSFNRYTMYTILRFASFNGWLKKNLLVLSFVHRFDLN